MAFIDALVPGDHDSSSLGQLRRDAAAKDQKSVKLTATAPLEFAVKESKTFSHTATSITFRDGTVVEGASVEDKMTLQVDKVDVRSSLDEDKALAWHYLGDEWKKAFEEHSKEEAESHKKFDPRDERYLRHVKQMEIHAPTVAEHNTQHGGKHSAEAHAPGEEHAAGGHAAHYPEIVIDRKDVAFWSSFTPKWNTYYAIYFTLTGLHGMHVVAGALVLFYFLVFDGRRLKEDPEHLANRVEVGGLFWHFVDLVWIFLFPLLYLL
ncbi:MAG: cytochrome c oxidase subunit 3 [Verrucomicrobiaceae bacterium]|nr:cytochrome c oxidase subunit 3 [Verrucomicrobiaceae bacterium]